MNVIATALAIPDWIETLWPDWIGTLWPYVVGLLGLIAAIAATVHAVLWKRDTKAIIGWVGLVWLAPLVGGVAYFLLGINRIQRKATSLKLHQFWTHRDPLRLPDGDQPRPAELIAKYPDLAGLAQLGLHITDRPLLPGNTVTPLIDGDQAYPAMLQAIAQAERSVTLLSFIFDSDRVGDAFLHALVQAMERGVEVRVLIDHVGSRYSRPNMVRRLRAEGIPVRTFLPTLVPRLFKYANLRNHRKILVIDGKVGFTGGTNIREGHWLTLQPDWPIRCLHFRLEGPVVSQLQETFATDWAFASGESLHGELWFPALEEKGSVWARGIADGPDEDFEKLPDLLLGALATATQSVRIVTPYFLPHPPLIHALNVTAMCGVEVDILLPAKNNIPLVQWAATAQFWQLLEKGCRIHLMPPPFDHTKLMVIDGVWSLIGSSNWDPRSLRLNFEFNVECYDEKLARRLTRLVDFKLQQAQRVTLEQVNSRSWPIQLRDGLSRLASPYL